MLHEQPRDGSRARDGLVFASPAMVLTPQGLMLGAGTILLAAEQARKLQSLKGREQRVLALLSAAYGTAVAPSVLGNIERAAKSWVRATTSPPIFIWRTPGYERSTIFRKRRIACVWRKARWITAPRRVPYSRSCVSTRTTSTPWKNSTIRNSRG